MPRYYSSYYKTKLNVHNWSVFNLATVDITCYIWHERNGTQDENVFASMIGRFLNEELDNKRILLMIIWSEGCTNQKQL